MRHTPHGEAQAFERRFEAAGLELGMTRSSVLLAVSGGGDSLALLFASHAVRERLALRLEVASFDHGLRAGAAQELAEVRRICERLGVPFHTSALSLAPGAGIEARARAARYAALEALRSERALDAVATGHTATDQAETLLMRLTRGSALRGAAGILSRRGRLLRPLLWATREDTTSYVAAQGERPAVDPMNADPSFLRVRMRQDVLPALVRSAGAASVLRMAAFARSAAEDEALLDALAQAAFERLEVPPLGLDAVGVRALPAPLKRRVLVRLIERAGATVDGALLERALRAVAEGGRAGLQRGLSLLAEGGVVRCREEGGTANAQGGMALAALDGAPVADDAAELELGLSSRAPPADSLFVPLREVHLPLVIRRWKAGDRTAGPRSRKVQDVLVDARVPREVRADLPVVADARGEVVWIVGVWPHPATSPAAAYLWARPSRELRARDWLVRYRVRPAVRRAK